MRKIAVCLVVALCNSIGWAQSDTVYYGGMGYFAFGTQAIRVKELSDRLHQAGYGRLSETALLIGGGGAGVIGRFLIGGEGCAVIGRKASDTAGEASLGGGWGTFLVGYTPVVWNKIRVVVFGGIGAGGLSVELRRERGEISFDSLLRQPVDSPQLSTGGLLVQGGLGVEIELIPGLLVGLRGGYMLPLGWDALSMRGARIIGVPAADLQGWSVRLFIGGGSPFSTAQ